MEEIFQASKLGSLGQALEGLKRRPDDSTHSSLQTQQHDSTSHHLYNLIDMAQSYSPQPSARWSSSSFQLPVDSETPPPPPPKPDSHEASRRGTPLAGSLSTPPSQSQGYQSPRNYPSDYNPAVNPAVQGYGAEQPQALAEPPRLEDEWLPDIVKNKPCVRTPIIIALELC